MAYLFCFQYLKPGVVL